MNLISKRIRGMQDVLPQEGEKWLKTVDLLINTSKLYGFKFIRTPVLEHTDLFERSAGDQSDIVNKEMYSFKDKGERDVSLRPEGTAGAMRLVLENGIHNQVLPIKLMYYSSCYRYEKPQLGRYREFFQFGLEIYGSNSIWTDYELICVGDAILKELGIKDVKLNINTIGCKRCRAKYIKTLQSYFENHKDCLCSVCSERLDKNPLRILDCKNIKCKEIVSDAPKLLDYVCDECLNRFNELQEKLNSVGISYIVDTSMVRGLDYYNGIVFEFLTKLEGSYIAIGGGGRYDSLSQTIGGVELPSVGLGFGVERILAVMDKQNLFKSNLEGPCLYTAAVGNDAKNLAFNICNDLRKRGVYAEFDISDKTLKSQMKYANKLSSKYIVVIGEDELSNNKAVVRNMTTHEEFTLALDENFSTEFLKHVEI